MKQTAYDIVDPETGVKFGSYKSLAGMKSAYRKMKKNKIPRIQMWVVTTTVDVVKE